MCGVNGSDCNKTASASCTLMRTWGARFVFGRKGVDLNMSDIGFLTDEVPESMDNVMPDESENEPAAADAAAEGEDGGAAEEDDAPDVQKKLYTQSQLDDEIKKVSDGFAKKLDEMRTLSGMNDEQRAEYRRDALDRELAEREAAVAKRELAADAAESLERAGLPKQLAVCLNYGSREECRKSLDAVRKAFGEAVAYAMTERMRGRVPRAASANANDAFLDGLGV